MSNEVTTPKQTGLGALNSIKAGLANVRAAVPEVGGKPILRMLQEKDGWVFGQEDNALPLGTEIVFNTLAIKHGYVCWTDRKGEKNELLEERMWGITQAATPIHEMPALHDPKTEQPCQWKQAFSADAKILGGKHKGTEVVYKPSSMGGAQAMGALMDAIMEKFDSYPDGFEGTMYVLPIVELRQKAPYSNKSGGKTSPPHFEIVGWMDLEGNEEDGDDAEDTDVKAVDEKVAAPEPEPEQAEEAPRRRRRA
jgi:hypothetical protein